MSATMSREALFFDELNNSTILKSLNDQRKETRLCDIMLKVFDEQIFAHSNVLAAASPYFGSFVGTGQDVPRAFSQKNPQVIEIHVYGNEGDGGYPEAVRRVVDYMYTNCISLNAELVSPVMEIARIMHLDHIISFCNQFIQGSCGTTLRQQGKRVETASSAAQTDSPLCVTETHPVAALQETTAVATVSLCEENIKTESVVLSGSEIQITFLEENSEGKTLPPTESTATTYTATAFPETGEKENVGEVVKIPRKRGRPRKNPLPGEAAPDATPPEPPVRKEKNEQHFKRIIPKRKLQQRIVAGVPVRSSSRQRAGVRQGAFAADFVVHSLKRKSRAQDNDDSDSLEEALSTSDESEPELELEGNDDDESAEGQERPVAIYHCSDTPDCQFEATTTRELTKHRKMVHGYRRMPYRKCDRCDFQTKRRKEFLRHRMGHLHSEKTCSYCEFQADSEEEFKTHLEKHTGSQPYFCHVCDMRFKTKAQLNTHSPKHWDRKPYSCSLCHAGFKWKHALKNHMITHSSSKDHLCDVCGFATAHKSQLKAHRLIHTGETFKCPMQGCQFEATKRQNLKYHMLTHTQEKPHQCEVCGHSFSLIKNMKRHMLLHTDQRPYKCTICPFATTRYDKLKAHILKAHGVGDPPTKKHRITDYQLQGQTQTLVVEGGEDEEGTTLAFPPGTTLHTVTSLPVEEVGEGIAQETQFITTPEGIPIITHVPYTDIVNIQYVT